MLNNIKLRAHHGLCIAFFEGKGYDENFVKNMTTVIAKLEKNPNIIIVSKEDNICAECPNNINSLCLCSEKVDEYDKNVLKLCNIKTGDVLPWKTYSALVNDNIIKAGKMEFICGNCTWANICFSKAAKIFKNIN